MDTNIQGKEEGRGRHHTQGMTHTWPRSQGKRGEGAMFKPDSSLVGTTTALPSASGGWNDKDAEIPHGDPVGVALPKDKGWKFRDDREQSISTLIIVPRTARPKTPHLSLFI